MKVLLRDDVAGVGRRGDIVKVAGGFARNFLLPEGRAILASDGVEGQATQMRRGLPDPPARKAKDRGAAEAQATILAGAVIPISRPGPVPAGASSAPSAPKMWLQPSRPPRVSRSTGGTSRWSTTSRRPGALRSQSSSSVEWQLW